VNKKFFQVRYVATKSFQEAREKADAEGYDPSTAEQTDFEVLGVKEERFREPEAER
jgi:hypothetical protein